jgi:hypothetical protein
VDADTGEPLRGVPLTILDWKTLDDEVPTTTSDRAGAFRFSDLKPSPREEETISLYAEKVGYEHGPFPMRLGSTHNPLKLGKRP